MPTRQNLMICAVLMVLLTTSSGLASLTDGLVAYYPFDGDANDASGNGYNLTVYGAAPTSDRCGNADSAYRCDGVDDYIEGRCYEIIVPGNQVSFAVSFWFSPTTNWIEGVNPNSMLVGNHDDGWGDWGVMIADWPGAELYFWWLDEDPGPAVELKTTTNSWNAGTWYHVLYNYDASTKSLSAWINGMLENTTTMADIGRDNGDTIRIGRYNLEYADMSFDELRIYDRALTNEECALLAESFCVLAPNGGEELIAGQTATIEWCIIPMEDANVALDYSTDNGGTWSEIAIAANTGSYSWLVPQVTSNQCLVRVSDVNDPNICDTSDDVFTIYICQLSGAAAEADIDDNCKVDFTDFSIWSQQWLKNGNPFDPAYTEAPGGMALVTGGEFEMGDHFNEGFSYELPVHAVTVDSFYMGKYEITNQQYCDYLNSAIAEGLIEVRDVVVYAVGGSDPYFDPCCLALGSYSEIRYSDGVFNVRTRNGLDMNDYPVVKVSWYGAAAYCNWRSEDEGYQPCYNLSTWDCDFSKQGYRLATEAEWEYAARGGLAGRRFPWGDTISHSQANYVSSASYSYDVSPTRGYHPTYSTGDKPYTSPVGSFAANGYGLYDMAGNVYEWCNDWGDLDSDYYSVSPYDNPRGPDTGTTRVVRSCGWSELAGECRVAHRSVGNLDGRSHNWGFRVVRRSDGGAEPVAFHVDGVSGDDGNDGLSRETAFKTIQKGIDTAGDGEVVLVWPGVYVERIYFYGKAITVKSADYPAVIEAPWQDAVSFIVSEGSGSVLSNFVIRRSMIAIACNNESSPTLKNLTIVDNEFGIAAYEASQPNISNCILWSNQYGDLYGCEARYSCVKTGSAGIGSISADPMIADLDGGNYHLLSENGRYVPAYGLWSFDDVTSPCVDAGDLADDFSGERMPNGARINMGAYGGTPYASMGEWPKRSSATVTREWISRMSRASAMSA